MAAGRRPPTAGLQAAASSWLFCWRDHPVLVKKRSLPRLWSTRRCLNIGVRLYGDISPFAAAGLGSGLGAQPVTAAKKQHLLRLHLTPTQLVAAQFSNTARTKPRRDPGPPQPPHGVPPGWSQGCREQMDALGGQGGSWTKLLVLLGVFFMSTPYL